MTIRYVEAAKIANEGVSWAMSEAMGKPEPISQN
jgi:hypothetical protein